MKPASRMFAKFIFTLVLLVGAGMVLMNDYPDEEFQETALLVETSSPESPVKPPLPPLPRSDSENKGHAWAGVWNDESDSWGNLKGDVITELTPNTAYVVECCLATPDSSDAEKITFLLRDANGVLVTFVTSSQLAKALPCDIGIPILTRWVYTSQDGIHYDVLIWRVPEAPELPDSLFHQGETRWI